MESAPNGSWMFRQEMQYVPVFHNGQVRADTANTSLFTVFSQFSIQIKVKGQ